MASNEKFNPVDQLRTHRVNFRLTEEEYKKVVALIAKTTHRTISIYARKLLLGQPVTMVYRDASKDKAIEELSALRRELGAIANNFNQLVKKIHKLDAFPNKQFWLSAASDQQQQLQQSISNIQEHINKIARRW